MLNHHPLPLPFLTVALLSASGQPLCQSVLLSLSGLLARLRSLAGLALLLSSTRFPSVPSSSIGSLAPHNPQTLWPFLMETNASGCSHFITVLLFYYLPERFQKIVYDDFSIFHFCALRNMLTSSGSRWSCSPNQYAVKLSATYSFLSAVAYADMPVEYFSKLAPRSKPDSFMALRNNLSSR